MSKTAPPVPDGSDDGFGDDGFQEFKTQFSGFLAFAKKVNEAQGPVANYMTDAVENITATWSLWKPFERGERPVRPDQLDEVCYILKQIRKVLTFNWPDAFRGPVADPLCKLFVSLALNLLDGCVPTGPDGPTGAVPRSPRKEVGECLEVFAKAIKNDAELAPLFRENIRDFLVEKPRLAAQLDAFGVDALTTVNNAICRRVESALGQTQVEHDREKYARSLSCFLCRFAIPFWEQSYHHFRAKGNESAVGCINAILPSFLDGVSACSTPSLLEDVPRLFRTLGLFDTDHKAVRDQIVASLGAVVPPHFATWRRAAAANPDLMHALKSVMQKLHPLFPKDCRGPAPRRRLSGHDDSRGLHAWLCAYDAVPVDPGKDISPDATPVTIVDFSVGMRGFKVAGGANGFTEAAGQMLCKIPRRRRLLTFDECRLIIRFPGGEDGRLEDALATVDIKRWSQNGDGKLHMGLSVEFDSDTALVTRLEEFLSSVATQELKPTTGE